MPRRVTKVVFPAAGLGTRFLPATKSMPKEMLPLVDKPLIQYGVEEAVRSGLNDIYIVTGRGKTAIEDHFDYSFELEYLLEEKGKHDLLRLVREISELVDIAYVRQKQALGLGHAVLCARDLVGHEPFGVLLSDDVIDSKIPCLQQLTQVYEEYNGSVIALMEVPREQIGSYGAVRADRVEGYTGPGELYRVHDLVEKPKPDVAPSNLAIIGRYVLAPEIFHELELTERGSGGEIQLTDGIRRLAKSQPIYGLKFEGTRFDAGDKQGFLRATVDFALRREDLGPEFRDYLKSLSL